MYVLFYIIYNVFYIIYNDYILHIEWIVAKIIGLYIISNVS